MSLYLHFLESRFYRQSTVVPLKVVTHDGADVAIYATGPWSHLFQSTHEQHYIFHVMAFASCTNENSHTHSHCVHLQSRQNGRHSQTNDQSIPHHQNMKEELENYFDSSQPYRIQSANYRWEHWNSNNKHLPFEGCGLHNAEMQQYYSTSGTSGCYRIKSQKSFIIIILVSHFLCFVFLIFGKKCSFSSIQALRSNSEGL